MAARIVQIDTRHHLSAGWKDQLNIHRVFARVLSNWWKREGGTGYPLTRNALFWRGEALQASPNCKVDRCQAKPFQYTMTLLNSQEPYRTKFNQITEPASAG